jgi:hypothetical protein
VNAGIGVFIREFLKDYLGLGGGIKTGAMDVVTPPKPITTSNIK